MRDTMTGSAHRILLVDHRTVRLLMAVLAGRNLAVLRMATGTGQPVMFGPVGLQQFIGLFMATTAQGLDLINGI